MMIDYAKMAEQLRARAELKCKILGPGVNGTGVYLSIPDPDQTDAVLLRAAADAIDRLRSEQYFHRVLQLGRYELSVYDEEEIHENCTVQVWRNSVTGEESVGWFENEQ